MSASNGSLDDVLPWSAALSAGGGGAGGARGGSGSGDASSAALPAGRVVVTDAVDAEGDFVLQHMIARSLCAGRRVCVVGVRHAYAHYATVVKKLGASRHALDTDPRLVFVDAGGGAAYDEAAGGLRGVFRQVADGLATTPGCSGSMVVVDDLSALLDVTDSASFGSFWGSLRALCEPESTSPACSAVVGLIHADIGSDGDFHGDEGSVAAARVVADADYVVSVRPLDTGYTKEVNGSIVAWRQPRAGGKGSTAGLAGLTPHRAQFKLLDSSIKTFQVGEARLF